MYDSLTLKPQNEVAQPVTTVLYERLDKLMAHQDETLTAIENKLHQILNLRQEKPEKQVRDEPKQKDISDFVAALNQGLTTIENNNSRLISIMDHLRRII